MNAQFQVIRQIIPEMPVPRRPEPDQLKIYSPFFAVLGWYFGALLMAGLAVINKTLRSLYRKTVAYWFMKFAEKYHPSLDQMKTDLFAELVEFQSLDAGFRSRGIIRVLEIGVGPGSNFRYYPSNCLLTLLDNNEYYEEPLDENVRRFPHITLEYTQLFEGEYVPHLATVEDGSYDVVVTTKLLCNVEDVDLLLREIIRILAPGGKYFFLEHVVGDDTDIGRQYRRKQRIWNLLTSYVLGCHLTRDVGTMIETAGFAQTDVKRFILSPHQYNSRYQPLLGPHIVGTATK